MSNIHKRMLLFLIGCMGTRFGLTLLAYLYRNNITVMKIFGALALIPAIGFTVIYLGGFRKTGAEVFGEQIWWNMLRPIHALLFFLFAFTALNGLNNAWMFLLLDTLIGLGSFIAHHWLYIL